VGRRSASIIFGWIERHLLYWLGISPERLARIYRAHAPQAQEWGYAAVDAKQDAHPRVQPFRRRARTSIVCFACAAAER
jgi:hypothetical protein